MDNKCNMAFFDKTFAIAKVDWKIENFCFSIRTGKCRIYSPDFNLKDAHMTKWRMILEVTKAEGTKGYILFYLERLSDSGPDSVLVDWELTMTAGKTVFAIKPVDHLLFEKKSKKVDSLHTVDQVLKCLLAFEPDTLKIECNLIVRKKVRSVILNKPVAAGLSCLSSDLKNLFHSKKYQDIIIQVGDKDIKAHKVILSRNKIFKSILDEQSGNVLELNNMFTYDDLHKLISYIYSGDMEYIILNPTLSMFKCVKYFECDALLHYFAPEILNMNTRFVVEEHILHWSINDVSSREEVISSPLFKGLNAETSWMLHFHPISTENIEYNAIIANLAEGKKPPYFTIEIAIENVRGETCFPQRLLRYNQCYEAAEFPKFTKLNDLVQSSLLIDDTLNIVFKVRTSAGEQVSSLGTSITYFMTYTQEHMSYRKLASNMDKLLKENRYADVIIQCEEEMFLAHRCILSTRSQKLASIINSISQSQIVCLVGIKANTFRMLLDYIYCGSLEDCEFDDLLLLYEASFCYSISSLKKKCGEILLTKVTEENREIVYRAAENVHDIPLMNLVS